LVASYFSSTFNLDLRKPSFELMIIYLATTIGSVGGGFFSSWLVKKGWPTLNARKAALLLFAIIELSVIMIQFVTDVWIAVGLLSVAVAVHQAWLQMFLQWLPICFPKKLLHL
jgi:ACS family hexuronate transporter-like MFS transporter